MKKALVTGAGGFIGHHLVRYLKNKHYWVCGVDIKEPEFSSSSADVFKLLDLRNHQDCSKAVTTESFDEVYNLAADMGGMGFIGPAECDIMRNSALINSNMICAVAEAGIKHYFFSSSVCIYRDMQVGESELGEDDAYPAHPDNEYGWEKLYAERMAFAYGRKHNIKIRVGRFQNCFGPEGAWQGSRAKAPAAICRKIAEAEDGGTIDIWGDGTAVRSYTYVDDMVTGIYLLMQSDFQEPVNIGNPEYINVNALIRIISEVAGKEVRTKYIDGPVGVQSRNFSNEKIYSLGWKPKFNIRKGVENTYPWILEQLQKHEA